MRSSFYSAVLEKGVLAWVGAFESRGAALRIACLLLLARVIFSRYNKVRTFRRIHSLEQFWGIVDRLP